MAYQVGGVDVISGGSDNTQLNADMITLTSQTGPIVVSPTGAGFMGDSPLYVYAGGSLQFNITPTDVLYTSATNRMFIGDYSLSDTEYYGGSTVRLPRIVLSGAGYAESSLVLHNWLNTGTDSAAGGGAIHLVAGGGGTLSGSINIALNSNAGSIYFSGVSRSPQTSGQPYTARNAAMIACEIDGAPSITAMPGRLVFETTASGGFTRTEGLRLTQDKVICYNQPAPTSKSAAATLTVAELKTGIIQYTGAAATLTLPTGTLTEGGFNGLYTNMTFHWSVINTGSGTCTIGAGTAHTIVGGTTIAAGTSGRFASRRSASNTFISYRIS